MTGNLALVLVDERDLVWLRDSAEVAFEVSPEATAFELEASLPGIHFLLTGHEPGAGPIGFLADLGVGEVLPRQVASVALPLRALSPPLVGSIAAAIESLSAGTVRARLDSDALRDLEPFAGHPFADDEKEWLLAVLQGLMTFLRKAADLGLPVLVVPL